MPADVVGAFQAFIEDRAGLLSWEGEVPRYDPSGNPIVPGLTGGPTEWPVFQVQMPESGMTRTRTFEDPYADEGPLHLRVWGLTRAEVLVALSAVEALVNVAANVASIAFSPAGPPDNPYYFIDINPERWSVFQEEGVRTADGRLLYQGQFDFTVAVHGALWTAG